MMVKKPKEKTGGGMPSWLKWTLISIVVIIILGVLISFFYDKVCKKGSKNPICAILSIPGTLNNAVGSIFSHIGLVLGTIITGFISIFGISVLKFFRGRFNPSDRGGGDNGRGDNGDNGDNGDDGDGGGDGE